MTPSLTGNMFWVFLETKLEAPSFVSQKTGIWIYCCKMRCFKLHSTQNMFCFVNNNIELPWAVCNKKKKAFLLFSFLLLKHVRIKYIAWKAYFWLVCREIVLLPALLQLENIFFQFAANYPGFYFILLKTTFLHVSG